MARYPHKKRSSTFRQQAGATGAVTSATVWLIAASAIALVTVEAPAFAGAYTGALIEYAYGIAIFVVFKPNAIIRGV